MKRVTQIVIGMVVLAMLLGGCSEKSGIYQKSDIKEVVGSNVTDSAEKNSQMEVHFLDVGQGDSTLIECDGHAMLIDAGNNNKGTTIQDYLAYQNITELDYVIGTHPDADHVGGLDVIMSSFDCSTIILPDYSKNTETYQEVMDTIQQKDYSITYPVVGKTYSLGSAEFTIIAPDDRLYESANDYSVGILLEYGDTRFVLIGDAEEESEQDILNQKIDITADVYKVSHHGSKTGTTDAFLKAVNPDFAVISCEEGNSYGHPHAEVLNKLRSAGISVFRTDEQGSIIATSDGENITWNTSPSASWKSGEPTISSDTGKSGESTISSDVGKSGEPTILSDTEKSEEPTTSSNAEKSGENEISHNQGAPEPVTYMINKNTKKFHLPTCSYVDDMADKNKDERSISKEELMLQGYKPCSQCIGE